MALVAAQVRPRDYVSLQAYLPYGQDDQLEALRPPSARRERSAGRDRRLRAAIPALDRTAPQGRPEQHHRGPAGPLDAIRGARGPR